MLAAKGKSAPNGEQATRSVVKLVGQLRFDQRGKPLVPGANRIKTVCFDGHQRCFCLGESTGLRMRQGLTQKRNVFTQWPAAGATAGHCGLHGQGGAGPVAIQQHQQTALKLVGRLVNRIGGVQHEGGGPQVLARQFAVSRRQCGQHHHQMRFDLCGIWPLLHQSQGAACTVKRLAGVAQQGANQHSHAIPAQQGGRCHIGAGAHAVDLDHDAVKPRALAGPQQVVGQ